MAEDNIDQTDNIKDLRQAADEGRKARQELEQARRENAFLKAGIDIEGGQGKLLYKAYDGDLTADAIKASAEEYGINKPTEEPKVTEPEHDARETEDRANLASGSGTPSTQDPADPYDNAMDAFNKARRSGSTPETASGAAFSEIVRRANAGDKRVIFE